ncbi:unnamed protein product [Dracunculus medinensis]|uniref:Glutamate receptor n=1 Tax=Dracunculus medinensis TaxID=318479 RepID=A0A0N4U170_DRAME|nr:unnamed protein product [Dracunculus medinensis]
MRRIASKYNLNPVDCILPRGTFYPSHVLDCFCNKLIKEKVVLIVFVTASESFDHVTSAIQYFLSIASQTGIPIIAWNADNAGFTYIKDLSKYRMLQMAPPIEHQIRAMIAILKRYNWSNFGVVTSKIAGSFNFLQLVQEAVDENNDRSFKLRVVHHEEIDDDEGTEHIEQRLDALKKSEAHIFLLYSTANAARKIFQVANNSGMLGEKYLWIGTQSVKGSMTSVSPPFQPGMLSVNFHTVSNAMFPPVDDVLPLIIGTAPKIFGLALSKLRPNESFTMQSTSSCENDANSTSWREGEIIYRRMKETFVKGNPYHTKDGLDSFFYMFNEYGKLKDSYLTISNLRTKRNKDSRNENLIWDKVGEFTNNELRIADIEWPGGKANPPQGTADIFHVKVVTLHEPPFIIVSDLDPETGTCPGNQGTICDWGIVGLESGGIISNRTLYKCCSGYCVDLLEKLAKDIGFTYTLYKVRDEKWGIKTEKGWNGLIQDLILHRADMCVTSLKLNSERAKDIDFSIPFLETGITIIVKIRSGVLSPTAFLEPFEYSTWAIILFVSIQGSALAIFVFEWVSPYSFNMKKYPPPEHKFSLCRSYWLVWATLFSASVSTDVPRSTVSRIMALVWAAFGLTFLAVYTANLAAFMITRVQYYELSGIHDERLINPEDQKPPFRYGTVEGGNTHETMKRNWHRMNRYVTSQNFFRDNISSGIASIKNELELDAFIYDAVVLDYQAGKDANCELITVGKWATMTGYGIGFPKNSPHLQKVNQYMLQYQQKGDLERLQNFWMTGGCLPDSNSQTRSTPLGVENFMSAFFLLIAGIVCITVLVCEYFFIYQLRKPLQRIDRKGWCGIISMEMAKSITFPEAVNRVTEWRQRNLSLAPSSANTTPMKNIKKCTAAYT